MGGTRARGPGDVSLVQKGQFFVHPTHLKKHGSWELEIASGSISYISKMYWVVIHEVLVCKLI